ncbi:MAG: class A beta-lactamase-related serine hydrolase [Scytonematopsis contorta HA4267-MV1]|jgi:hypothetical protein|nr:class A beta-lactamase-related serine hydrolase [Scytonematopsis contorta HA4267-MV1]
MPKKGIPEVILKNKFLQSLLSKVKDLTWQQALGYILLCCLATQCVLTKTPKSHTQQLSKPRLPPLALQVTTKTVSTPTPPKKLKASIPSGPLPEWANDKSLPLPSRLKGKENSEVVYNLKKPLHFKQSKKLQAIIKDTIKLAKENNLPADPLSITLIDTKTGEIAGHNQDVPRYPASVVKMFWMVALYGQIENGIWADSQHFSPFLAKMIKESDNEAASFVLDQVTNTRSQSRLSEKKYKNWQNKRSQVNRFFQKAGYKNINVIQKAFPVYYIEQSEPNGSESQLLGEPITNWNKISSRHAARLMYEICYTKKAVSPKASQSMCELLHRDLNSDVWKKLPYDFNPVQNLLGQSLPDKEVEFYSKAGWTNVVRTEAAMVHLKKQKSDYILVVFGADPAYANDGQIFPDISRLIYQRMSK